MTHPTYALRGHYGYGSGDSMPGWLSITVIVAFVAYLGYRYWQGK